MSKLNIVYSFLLQSGPQNTPSILGPLPIYHPADHDVRYQSAVWKCNVYFDIQATHYTKQVFLRIHLFSLRGWCTWKILRPRNRKNTKKKCYEYVFEEYNAYFMLFMHWWYTFFLLYLYAKYELIWSDITAQRVTLGANLFVKAQSIPQNAKCVVFFSSFQKVAFLKIFIFWIWLRFFEIAFCNIEICENT